ncbi:MAG: hypothetical protein QM578_04565, partial [Pantoea sp.]|uniref:hypothetical protein n=1 Tax=Pantoea sp. TaxID=69393 RepID=UPI0039E668D2
ITLSSFRVNLFFEIFLWRDESLRPSLTVCVAALPCQWRRIIGIRIFCTTPFFDLFIRVASFHPFC